MIAAEGEKKASGALRDASEIISESSSALQLRYLQVLHTQAVFTGILFMFGSFLLSALISFHFHI